MASTPPVYTCDLKQALSRGFHDIAINLQGQPKLMTPNLNRSVQISQIAEESARHQLDVYGTPLPVLISEALDAADSQTELSVSVEPSGWAWLVCGRQLFIWNYKQLSKGSQCRELALPPSDLAYTSHMVAIIPPKTGNQVACVVVSPEGAARYWPSIAHDGAFAEVSLNLRGEVCQTIINLQGVYCIVGTSTSTLVLLTLTPGQMSVGVKLLRVQQGMLSGVSRRVSSLFWGSAGIPDTPSILHQIIAGEEMEDGSQAFYVLTGSVLQKWCLLNSIEKLLYQFDVEPQLRDHMSQAVWCQDEAQLPRLKTWLLDIQPTRDGVVLLGAGMNSDVSQQVHYVIGTIHTEGSTSPKSFLNFTVTRFVLSLQEMEDESVISYRLLLPDPAVSSAYIYNNNAVICLSATKSSQPYDQVEFRPPGDRLLGAGQCEGRAIFFSMAHGLVTLTESAPVMNASITMDSSVMNESVTMGMGDMSRAEYSLCNMEASKVEEMSMSNDKMAQLKAAFIYSVKKDIASSDALVEELLAEPSLLSGGDNSIDHLVVSLSQEMIDDYPPHDPRWAEAMPGGHGSVTSSLILLRQLEDKLKAHDIYISFLKTSVLWDKLSTVIERETKMSTGHVLCEHAEKILAAMTLHAHHSQQTELIDAAVKRVLQLRSETVPPSGLTPQDLFYRRVSRIHEILEALHQHEVESLRSNMTPQQTVSLVSSVSAIFAGMLHDACQYRESKASTYQLGASTQAGTEFLPWTASCGPRGLRTLLHKQHDMTVDDALPVAQDAQQRGALYQQLLELSDTILNSFRSQLESIRQSFGENSRYQEVLKKYETDRRKLIMPFMHQEQYERAASLAEKYCDFAILVQLCDDTNNQERLTRYMNQFQNKGFSDFVFKWYVDRGKPGALMSSQLASHPQLSRFLHSTDNAFLSWLHDINCNKFDKASETLKGLASKEEQYLAKKKTLLSLSKLALLAADDPPQDIHQRLQEINDVQDLILNQETLPQEVLECLGMDADNMKVMPAHELIELYVSNYNANANEFDFKKALDLLQYIPKNTSEYERLLLHIWCQAILRDRWTDIEVSPQSPLDNCKDTVFFKTIEMAYTENMDLRYYLPKAEKLLEAEELGDLRENTNFQYLVTIGYEQISQILA